MFIVYKYQPLNDFKHNKVMHCITFVITMHLLSSNHFSIVVIVTYILSEFYFQNSSLFIIMLHLFALRIFT